MPGMSYRSELLELFTGDPTRVAAAVVQALADANDTTTLPDRLARTGISPEQALTLVGPSLRGGARNLGHPGFLAHMDPPTPWVAWVAALLGASSNQNLLHPDTGPAARNLEATVLGWLAPIFGMDGGHLVPGSTVANLTALWAARDLTGADTVVASTAAHLSIKKAATILGLRYVAVSPIGGAGLTLDDLGPALQAEVSPTAGPGRAIVVLTAGTTGTGAIDHLDLGALDPSGPQPAWVHVDAAWAGPMRFSAAHRHRLDGIDAADSVAVSAHKWLFQPKESAMVLFADTAQANPAISVDGAYLAVPNVGLLGSHGTAAAPLAATLLTLGHDGVERLIDHTMAVADQLMAAIEAHPRLEAYGPNTSGVVAWRHLDHPSDAIRSAMAVQDPTRQGFVSTVAIDDTIWLRSVAANPMADVDLVVASVLDAARSLAP
jgi:L-2,4-diaminobutyrate decarboxylase